MKIETYQEQKKRHGDEINNFEGLFFAFSNEQLKEGMEKIGETDTKNIVSIGAGGYILKNRFDDFIATIDRQKSERKIRLKDEKNLTESLAYELANHEFCITGDPTAALNALDLVRGDIPTDVLKKAIDLSSEEQGLDK